MWRLDRSDLVGWNLGPRARSDGPAGTALWQSDRKSSNPTGPIGPHSLHWICPRDWSATSGKLTCPCHGKTTVLDGPWEWLSHPDDVSIQRHPHLGFIRGFITTFVQPRATMQNPLRQKMFNQPWSTMYLDGFSDVVVKAAYARWSIRKVNHSAMQTQYSLTSEKYQFGNVKNPGVILLQTFVLHGPQKSQNFPDFPDEWWQIPSIPGKHA